MNPVIILLIIIAIAAVIAVLAFAIHRFLNPKLKADDKPSEEQSVQEELDRLLKPIEDEETARQVSAYKDEDEEQ